MIEEQGEVLQRMEVKMEENEELREEKRTIEEEKHEYKQEAERLREEKNLKDRLMESIERRGIRRDKYLRKLKDPVYAIIIFYRGQDPEDWLKDELKDNYNAPGLANGRIVPPNEVPDELKNGTKSIDDWLDELHEKGDEQRESIVQFAELIDLTNNVTWRKDWPTDTKTINERANLSEHIGDEFYELEEVTDSLQHIERGDLGFFARPYIADDEVDMFYDRQGNIEDELENPDLKELVEMEAERIEDKISDVVADPENVAKGIKKEANMWYKHLYEADERQEQEIKIPS